MGLATVMLAAAHFAVAAELDTGLDYASGSGLSAANDPRVIAANIIRIVLGFLGIIAVGLIIYAGWLYMTAAGEPEKIEKAKKILIGAVIGLLICLASFAIASFILNKLIGATGGESGGGGNPPGGGGPTGPSYGTSVRGTSPGNGAAYQPQNTAPLFFFTNPIEVKAGLQLNYNGETEDETAVKFSLLKPARAQSQPDAAALNNNFKLEKIADVNPRDDSVTLLAAPEPITGARSLEQGDLVYKFTGGGVCRDAGEPDCLPNWSKFKATINGQGGIFSVGGRQYECLAGNICEFVFSTGEITDRNKPRPGIAPEQMCRDDGSLKPEANLVTGWARDDSSISFLAFNQRQAGETEDELVNLVPGTGQKYQSAEYQYDTSGMEVGDEYYFSLYAQDIASNEAASGFSAEIKPGHCCNGVKDADEAEVDCGGTECLSCAQTAKPIIMNITPAGGFCSGDNNKACQTDEDCGPDGSCDADTPNGAAGNFVTIKGRHFGQTAGQLYFTDDRQAALADSVNNNCSAPWSDNQIIAVLPDGAADGPIKVVNVNGNFDVSDNAYGSELNDFVVNSIKRPGLCLADPANGYPDDVFNLQGNSFNGSPRAVLFGNNSNYVAANRADNWSETSVDAAVPNIDAGRNSVFAKANNVSSNYLNFSVKIDTANDPVIAYIDPDQGPVGQYITIYGSNFKNYDAQTSLVEFYLPNDPTKLIIAGTDFPASCQGKWWHDTYITVKVPKTDKAGEAVEPGDYKVIVTNSQAKTSPPADFTITSGTPSSGLCLLDPNNGPAGQAVSAYGEKFGASQGGGKVRYFSDKDGAVSLWQDQQADSFVPAGAISGPVEVINKQSDVSNSLPFRVGKCSSTDQCGGGEECCGAGTSWDGVCRDDGSCSSGGPVACGFGWSFTTNDDDGDFCGNNTMDNGEQCDDGNTANGDGCNNSCQIECDTGEQCPSGVCQPDGTCGGNQLFITDWQPRGEDACGNGLIYAVFNQLMDQDSLTLENILLLDQDGKLVAGELAISTIDNTKTKVEFKIDSTLTPGGDYYVVIKNGSDGSDGVKSQAGRTLNETDELTMGDNTYTGKIWTFKVKSANGGICLLDGVSISPTGYTIASTTNNRADDDPDSADYDREEDNDKAFYAVARSGNQELTPIDIYSWSWDWEIRKTTVVNFFGGRRKFNSSEQIIVAQTGRSDSAIATATAMIVKDQINQNSTYGEKVQGAETIYTGVKGIIEDPGALKVTDYLPKDKDRGVCRNGLIQATFNLPMRVNSLPENILVAGDYGAEQCPANTKYLTAAYHENIFAKIKSWLARAPFLNKFFAAPARAVDGNFCAIPGSIKAAIKDNNQTEMEFKPNQVLEADRTYYVIIKSDSDPADGIADGVLSQSGLTLTDSSNGATFNAIAYQGMNWSFTTKSGNSTDSGICQLKSVAIEPASYLFKTAANDSSDDDPFSANYDSVKDNDKLYRASAYSLDNQPIAPLGNLYNWRWDWTIDNPDVVKFRNGTGKGTDNPDQILVAQNVDEANTLVRVKATITQDQISKTPTIGAAKESSAEVYLLLCANPWPPYNDDGSWEPWRDTTGNCTVQNQNADCKSTNFELYYCRDAGNPGTADDLPAILSDKTVIRDSVPGQDIYKEFYFFREGVPDISGVKLSFIINDEIKQGGKAALTWPPVVVPDGEYLDKYIVYYGIKSKSYTKSLAVTPAEAAEAADSVMISGLTNGVKYYFAVTAKYISGAESDYSAEVEFTPADSWSPRTPDGLTGSSEEAGAVISWTPNSDDTVLYKIYYGAVSGSPGVAVNLDKNKCGAAKCELTIKNLSGGTTYYFTATSLDVYNNESNPTDELSLFINN